MGVFISKAQINLPRGSQKATVSQTVGTSDVTIHYSRPSVKGREVWGKLVPFGTTNPGFGTATEAPWRAGADENTTISFSHDAKIEGKEIKAGTYGLHILVKDANNATIIFSKDIDSWGSFFYDEKNDALRVDVTINEVPHKELLTFEFGQLTPTST
ncbi:MAG: DUF2911 domain-containing protein, partial [Flavobacteriaceae bacterium]